MSTSSHTEKTTRTLTVLLADCHVVARLGTRHILDQTDDLHVVGEARTGFEAVEKAVSLVPDVLVLEARLPDSSVPEIAEELSSVGVSVPLLVLSAFEDEAALGAVLDGTVAGYVTKKDDLAYLVSAVRGVARGEGSWLSPSVSRRLLALRRQQSDLRHYHFSVREEQVLGLLIEGHDNGDIAEALNLSIGTVKNHLTNIYQKLGVSSRTEAIIQAFREKWHEQVQNGTPALRQGTSDHVTP